MWYLFHGPNSLARDEEIAKLKSKMGEPDIASLNTTLVEHGAPLKELLGACDAIPFLSEKRLVIARDWLSGLSASKRKSSKSDGDDGSPLQQLVAYLPAMPETTRLILAESEALPDSHPLIKLANDKTSGGHVKHFALPADPARWIAERTKSKGGDISPQAAQLLSTKINRGNTNDRDHFDSDSRTYLFKLDNELEKLVAYALNRRIETADVEALVRDEDVADIFKFIDAISVRDGEGAFRIVRGVLARGESPLVVLSHLARQNRLLIQAKEHPGLTPDQLAQTIGVHPFVAKKVSQQAERFSIGELESAHVALLEADLAIKTGRLDDVTALDLLVAALCS
jgi:DNA polymerase-3 subunit delta